MSVQASSGGFYGDFDAYAKLRAEARQDGQNPELIRKMAGQFEALFLQMVFKGMRDASIGEGMFESNATRTYQEMLDTQRAKDLATGPGGGLGLAEMITRQLTGEGGIGGGGGGTRLAGLGQVLSRLHARLPEEPGAAAGGEEGAGGEIGQWRPENPREFVEGLWPLAEEAAAELGVEPEVLLAQAALETGWGRAVSRHADGRLSHNLFNIKADQRWDGERVAVSTLEYRDGLAQRERASFRAYDSFADSFRDYVEFLRANPRYGEALQRTGEPTAFLQALQDAGYATDPGYAEKIGSILARDEFKETVGRIKTENRQPIS